MIYRNFIILWKDSLSGKYSHSDGKVYHHLDDVLATIETIDTIDKNLVPLWLELLPTDYLYEEVR